MSSAPGTIDTDLVRSLIRAQFPQWGRLRIEPVIPGGWDHRTFRLGDDLLVRLPSAEGYAVQVEKEQRWLPILGPHLPVPIPKPVGLGHPDRDYSFPWSVYRWLDGSTALDGAQVDLDALAAELAEFLLALHRVDTAGGPGPGLHTGYRGAPLSWYDAETRESIDALADLIDPYPATEMWQTALDAPFKGSPMWFHGDVAPGNLLIRNRRLAAVIDFGCAGVGDPACDLVIAWTLLDSKSRNLFRATLAPDAACWARGRGWALWKALITQRDGREPHALASHDVRTAEALRVLTALLAEPPH